MELLDNTKVDIRTTMNSLKQFLKEDISYDELAYINRMLVGIAHSSAMDTKNSINTIMSAIENLNKSV